MTDSPSLIDGMGRTVRYVRLSVTDRCNLRCVYCRSGFETFIPHESILRYEEMETLVDLAVSLGVEKVRLTGGEPFVRRGFLDFLERLRTRHPGTGHKDYVQWNIACSGHSPPEGYRDQCREPVSGYL